MNKKDKLHESVQERRRAGLASVYNEVRDCQQMEMERNIRHSNVRAYRYCGNKLRQ